MTITSTRPPTRRRGWRIAGITATVGVIGGGIVLGPALAWGFMQQFDTTTTQSAETFDRAPEAVSVDGTTANVTIAATSDEQVAVERAVEWARTEPTIEETWSGGAFAVDLDCPGGITNWFNDVCRIDYLAQVPGRTPADVSTTTGDITLDGAVAGGHVTATTGSITGTGLAAPSLTAETRTGSIELAYATTPQEITATVTTGDISITVPDDGTAYRIVGGTATGARDIQVATDPSAERVIDVTSTTGDVAIGYPG